MKRFLRGEHMESTIYFAGGCFWGMERLFRSLPGVLNATCGYANGDRPDHANYEAVCSGVTGFRETVMVSYDPSQIPLQALLFAFFAVVDVETPNRQGADVGSQYQSGVYWTDSETEAAVLAYAEKERAAVPVFTVELTPLQSFFPAEEFHQRYLEKHPRGYCHVSPMRISAVGKLAATLAQDPRPARQALAEAQSAFD